MSAWRNVKTHCGYTSRWMELLPMPRFGLSVTRPDLQVQNPAALNFDFMKIENSIGWCDDTTNAVTGCAKVSPGCKNCYAEVGMRARVLRDQGVETWGPKGVRHPVAGFAAKLRRLNKLCVCSGCHQSYPASELARMANGYPLCASCSSPLRRIRLFADSNSDWLDEAWPVETLASFLEAIRLAPNLDVILLTKRMENFQKRLGQAYTAAGNTGLEIWIDRWTEGMEAPANVWLGVSVEDQKRADERIPLLLQTPAAVRFLSVEPLLERISLRHLLGFKNADGTEIGWAIIGSESGPNRRDCGVQAIVDVAEQCRAAGVPCYVKQDCHRLPGQQGRIPDEIWARKEFPQ